MSATDPTAGERGVHPQTVDLETVQHDPMFKTIIDALLADNTPAVEREVINDALYVYEALRAAGYRAPTEAREAALWPIRNLAMEHMDCTGCPTPWWLKQALAEEVTMADNVHDPAEPDASSASLRTADSGPEERATGGDVEALANAVYRSREVNLPLADSLDVDCYDVARAVLASDWLDAVRRKAGADALTEAADDYERMHQQPGSATGADWLRRRADRIARESR